MNVQTNKDLIYIVKEQTEKSFISSNTGFSDQQILSYLLKSRSRLIYEKSMKYNYISEKNYMTTPCINLVEAVNCPCTPPSDCLPLMTEYLIPNYIDKIISVTNYDNTVEYRPTSVNLAKYRQDWRFKSFAEDTSYFENNEGDGVRLYFFSKKPIKVVKVTLIAEEPEQVFRMKDCNGNNANECVSSYDIPWVCDPEITKTVIDMTVQYIIGTRVNFSDLRNNAVDDNIQNKEEAL